MRSNTIACIGTVLFIAVVYAKPSLGQTIYKCETKDGVTFSSQPCTGVSNKIRVHEEGMSGGVDYFEGDEDVGDSEAAPHDGPVLKSLSGQVRDNKQWLYNYILTKKSPQQHCGSWIDKNGMEVIIPCNE